MITQNQTRQRQDENQCPNHHFQSSTLKKKSFPKKSPLKPNNHGGKAQAWPSVKQLRERYETVPGSDENKSLEDGGVVDKAKATMQRGREEKYSSGSSTTCRRQSSSSITSRYREHSVGDANAVENKKYSSSSGGTDRRQSSSSIIGRYREHSVGDDAGNHTNAVGSKKHISSGSRTDRLHSSSSITSRYREHSVGDDTGNHTNAVESKKYSSSSGRNDRRQSSSSIIGRYREHSVGDDDGNYTNAGESKNELNLKLRRRKAYIETKLPMSYNTIHGAEKKLKQDTVTAADDDETVLLGKSNQVVSCVDSGTEIKCVEIESISPPLPAVANMQQTETAPTAAVAHTSSDVCDPDEDAAHVEPVDTSNNGDASDAHVVETKLEPKLKPLGENDYIETTLSTSFNTLSSTSATLVDDGSLQNSSNEIEIDTTTFSDVSETDRIIARVDNVVSM